MKHFLLTVTALCCTSVPSDSMGDGYKPVLRLTMPEQRVSFVCFSADSRSILFGCLDKQIQRCDVPSGKPAVFRTYPDRVRWVNCSPDKKYMGVVCVGINSPGPIFIEDIDENKRLVAFPKPHVRYGIHARFASCARFFASAGDDGVVQVYDVPAKKIAFRTPISSGSSAWDIAFSPDSRLVATGSNDNIVRLWRVPSGEALHSINCKQSVESVQFSPDSRSLFAAPERDDGIVSLWEVATNKERLSWNDFPCRHVGVFIPGTPWIATAGQTGVIRFFDYRTAKLVHEIAWHKKFVAVLSVSPDGRWLASGSNDLTLAVHEVPRYKPDPKQTEPLSALQCEQAWQDLTSIDAVKAYQAIVAFGKSPASAAFLDAKLQEMRDGIPADRVAPLLRDLDDNATRVRDHASLALDRMRPAVVPHLRQALEKNPPEEVRRRLTKILDKAVAADVVWTRTMEALEMIGDREAQRVLAGIATQKNASGEEAQRSLGRLRR